MSTSVGQLTIEMAANNVRLKTDMDNARKTVSSSMLDIKKSAELARSALEMIGVGLSINFFKDYIKGAIDAADAINDLSKSTGLAVGELAGLGLAATQSGSDLEGTAQSINKLSVNIANDVKKFAAIGITAKDPLEAFKQLADVFVSIEDPQLKAAVAAEALGKKWQSAAPMLAEGSEGIAKMVARGKELANMTPELAAASDKFNDTLAELKKKSEGVSNQITEKLLPSLQLVADEMLRSKTNTSSFEEALNGLKTIFDTIIVLGAEVKFTVDVTLMQIKAVVEYLATIAGGGGFEAAKKIADDMTAYGENARKKVDEFTAKILASKPAVAVVDDEVARLINRTAKLTAAQRAALDASARAFISSNNTTKDSISAYDKMIKSADDLVASIKFESDAYAMSNVEKESAIALQKLMNMGLKEGTAEYEKYTEAVIGAVIEKEQMKALADLKKKEIEEEKKLEEKAIADRLKEEEKFADEIKSINNQIGQSLTDALMSGGMNARDFIVNMFKTMVLRPILQPVITGMVGMFTGGVASAAGGASASAITGGSLMDSLSLVGIAGKLKSAFDLVSGGFSGIGTAVGSFVTELSGAAAAADALVLSATGSEAAIAATAQLEAATALGASAASFATVASGIGAGVGLGTLISGDKSLIGGSGLITVGAGTAIGAGIGTMILPVVGTAIGAALGGIVGGLANQFGNGPKQTTDFGISGSLSSNGVNVQNYSEWEKQGGWFGSDKNGAEFSAVESKVSKYINASVAGSAIAVRQYADILGLPAKGISDFAFEIKRSMDGLNPEEATKALNELLAAYGNSLAATVTAEIGPFQRDGEEAGATLARLATSLQSVNSVFDTLNITLMETSLSGADASSKLVDMFGGIDKFVSATDAYYQAFYTEQERAAKTTEQLTNVFSQLGLSLPNTNAAFRAMVESARAAGNDGLFASLIKLAPTFSGLQTSLANMAAASGQAAGAIGVAANLTLEMQQALAIANTALDDSFSVLKTSIQAELDAALASIDKQKTIAEAARQVASESVSALKSIFDYLKGQVSDILATVNSAQTSAQGMSFVRNALVNAQNTGYLPDQALLSDAVSAARAGLSSENFATAFEMKRGNLLLAADLQQLQDIAGDQMSTAEQQLSIAEDQLSFLTAQAESTQLYYSNQLQMAQNQVNELRGINGGVLSVADAMASFGAAINATRAAANSTSNDLTAQVSQMYIDILGRAPDSAGLADWLSRGISSDQIRAGIMGSQEAKLRGYASGGSYPGGLAMVGESGPELINFNRPGQVYTSAQTNSLLSGETVAGEVRALREENQAQSRAIVQLQSRLTRVLERWDGNGMPETRVVA